jgi:hypothetical protein
MSVTCLWAGTSALSFGRAKSPPEENNDEGSLLRGRNLNTFYEAFNYETDYGTKEFVKGNGEGKNTSIR